MYPVRRPAAVPRRAAGVAVAAAGAILLAAGVLAFGPWTAHPSQPAASPAASPPAGGPAATPPSGSHGPGASPSQLPLPSGDPVLVGAGDIGRCDSDADQQTAALVERIPGYVFVLGDNAYESGSAADYRDCFGSSWGPLLPRIRFPVPGNHDWETGGAAGYLGAFGAAAAPGGTTWYSTDVGAWHVVVLDSTCNRVPGGCGTDSPQVRWLRDDLAASHATCTLALFHHPRWSTGEHGNDRDVAPFWDALYAAGADLVLNGHDHDYERFGPLDPAGNPDEARGIVEVVVGTGGAELRDFRDGDPHGVARSNVAHGVLEVTLGSRGWTSTFHSVDGSFADSGSRACH